MWLLKAESSRLQQLSLIFLQELRHFFYVVFKRNLWLLPFEQWKLLNSFLPDSNRFEIGLDGLNMGLSLFTNTDFSNPVKQLVRQEGIMFRIYETM